MVPICLMRLGKVEHYIKCYTSQKTNLNPHNNIQFTDHRVPFQVKRAIFSYTIRIEQVLDQTMLSLVILESQIGKESNNFMLGLPAYSKAFETS